jgi:hypothetical protein
MSSILLDFHNKLGDNIICNGLVREYAKKYDRVGIFCIPKYLESVAFMYRDLPNIEITLTKNQAHKDKIMRLHSFWLSQYHYGEIKKIQDDSEAEIVAERQVYARAGVPHEKKWSSFYVKRDPAHEEEFFNRVVTKQPYAFIHDDTIYGGLMDKKHFAPGLAEVRATPALSNNIFDYCKVIEEADEIHVVDSVFMFLVDCLPYHNPKQKLFVHRYARSNPAWRLPILKKDWTIFV